MKIEIFSDVVCPWCYIGDRRFARALTALPQDVEVDIVHRPFQLDPGATETAEPLRDYLARRFGAAAGSATARLTDVAAQEGIVMEWDRALHVNTREAHRLLRLARQEYDGGTERRLLDELFAAHFTHGRDIGDHAQLTQLAVTAGMNEDRVRDYLATDEGAAELESELEYARGIGIQSVPSFVIDGRYIVEGAQPVETFVEVLEEARLTL